MSIRPLTEPPSAKALDPVMAETNRGQKSHQVGRALIAGCIVRPNRHNFQLASRRSFGREKGRTRICRPPSGTTAPCPPLPTLNLTRQTDFQGQEKVQLDLRSM